MSKMRVVGATLALAAATTIVHADPYNKKTKVTFSQPVQVPNSFVKTGVTVLPAGSYIFRLLDSPAQRHLVQVTNMDGDKVYSNILAIPDYRVNASSKTVMYFSESTAGGAPPVKAWFYPGDNFGQRFVYPKAKAVEIAAAVNQPVPSTEVKVVERTKIVEVPVYIQTPVKQQTEYTASTFDKVDATDTAGVDGEAVPQPTPAAAPAKLPKTASPLEFIGIMGLLLLAAAFLMRRFELQLK